MEIQGKIVQKLQLQEGTSKAGNPWKKQEYILETLGNFPRKVKFDFFGDRVEQYPLEVGDEVTVSYDLESREFNGRWYTDVRAYSCQKGLAPTTAAAPPTAPAQSALAPAAGPVPPLAQSTEGAPEPPAGMLDNESGDLPF